MQVVPPELMPLWLVIVAIVIALLLVAWLVRTILVTRRDTSLDVGDIPMAPEERNLWVQRLDGIRKRWQDGDLELRALHLELAEVIRGFASARSGRDLSTATVRDLLDMADTVGPRSIMERLMRVQKAGRPLDTNPLGHVGELLAVWEQPSFDRDPQAEGDSSLASAQAVVTKW